MYVLTITKILLTAVSYHILSPYLISDDEKISFIKRSLIEVIDVVVWGRAFGRVWDVATICLTVMARCEQIQVFKQLLARIVVSDSEH